ncbi:hypothetical protein BD289DRAFT_334199, partial [Coniella lustricola]
LRDLCQCAACVSASSGQKNFSTADVPSTPAVQSHRIHGDGRLEITWAHDFLHAAHAGPDAASSHSHSRSHTSVFAPALLRQAITGSHQHIASVRPALWDASTYASAEADSKTISYADWMAGGSAYAAAVLALAKWGLVLVTGLPETTAAVQDVAEKMGHVQSTFYGPTWDVVSKPNAENAAYTSEFLCLHQDLLYYRDSPKIQLLHCLSNDCEGGDSLFSDGLRAAYHTMAHRPDDFDVLSTNQLFYQYSRNGHYYRHHRPVIELAEPRSSSKPNRTVYPRRVSWSPPFQGPLPRWAKTLPLSEQQQEQEQEQQQQQQQQQDPARFLAELSEIGHGLDAWHPAAKRFRDDIEAPHNMIQYRLKPGDCAIFDNERVLHGRTRFNTASGHRHLRGTYLDQQAFESAL